MKVTCTVQYATAVSARVSARLVRNGAVLASTRTRARRGRAHVRLASRLRRGAYTVVLTRRVGGVERVTRTRVSVR